MQTVNSTSFARNEEYDIIATQQWERIAKETNEREERERKKTKRKMNMKRQRRRRGYKFEIHLG